MEYVSVIAAAVAGYVFGAIWYMSLAKPWMDAVGLSEADISRKDPKPFIVSFVMLLIVAGMMRHVFALSGIDTVGKGLVSGLGLGLFIAAPWIAANNAFAGRSLKLTLIDGGYAAGGCMIVGLVLALF